MKDEQGEPWFLGMDVCKVLELENTTNATRYLDSSEKSTITRSKCGMSPGAALNIINESGLYKLIMRSDKPQAKPFQDWVTKVVLPSIRKTGGYIAGEEKMDEDDQGEPWFVAKDVLAVLQLNSMAFHRIDDNEKGVSSIYTPGGNQTMRTVSESGLYKLIMRSRKPQDWVTQVVLRYELVNFNIFFNESILSIS